MRAHDLSFYDRSNVFSNKLPWPANSAVKAFRNNNS